MISLIIGGSGSGKSAFAEDTLLARSGSQRIYIATMQPMDQECLARIERHRVMRAQKSFQTIECYTHLHELRIADALDSLHLSKNYRNPCHDRMRYDILLECISNLVANECFAPQGSPNKAVQAVVDGVHHLAAQAAQLVLVSSAVFSDGIAYDASTKAYMRCLAQVHARLAYFADEVIEMAAGYPLYYKRPQSPRKKEGARCGGSGVC